MRQIKIAIQNDQSNENTPSYEMNRDQMARDK
jgi:hypothetical protein